MRKAEEQICNSPQVNTNKRAITAERQVKIGSVVVCMTQMPNKRLLFLLKTVLAKFVL